MGFEPTTPCLASKGSAAELRAHKKWRDVRESNPFCLRDREESLPVDQHPKKYHQIKAGLRGSLAALPIVSPLSRSALDLVHKGAARRRGREIPYRTRVAARIVRDWYVKARCPAHLGSGDATLRYPVRSSGDI